MQLRGIVWMGALLTGILLGDTLQAGQEELRRGRTDGMQVWNCHLLADACYGDHYGVNFENIKPVQIVGVRNGVFSGRLVVSNSNGAIEGLQGKATDLVSTDGKAKIAAERVQVRFAVRASKARSWMPHYRYDGLWEKAPEEINAIKMRKHRRWTPKTTAPVAAIGAWITVRVPADAAPGVYKGIVTLQAEDDDPTDVPVQLKVHDWRLPDGQHFNVRNLGYLSKFCVAHQYEEELWSDRHMAMMGKCMSLMGEVGSRAVMIHLVTGYYAQDTNESMVKWLRQADGTYKYDFTALDKFIETCAKSLPGGKPYPFRINMFAQRDKKDPKKTLPVTVIDAKSGKVESMQQPPYGSPESEAFWKPVLAEVRARLEKRGWLDVTVFGDTQYCGHMLKENVSLLLKLWPGAKGYSTQHGRATRFSGLNKGERMPVPFAEFIWSEPKMSKTRYRKIVGRPAVYSHTSFARNRHGEPYQPYMIVYRRLIEEMLLRNMDGVGELGVDLWPIKDPKRDGRYFKKGGGHIVGPDSSTRSLLAPSPDGPVATERYELFREGVQVCEAILFLQRLLDEKKLDAKLATRVAALLKQRAETYGEAHRLSYDRKVKKRMRPVLSSLVKDALQHDEAVFALATEVAKSVPSVSASPKRVASKPKK